MTHSSFRVNELYTMALEKYAAVVDLELGENNALLAAIAVMIVDSEKLRTWKTPALIGDPHEEGWDYGDGRVEPVATVSLRGNHPVSDGATRQLELPLGVR